MEVKKLGIDQLKFSKGSKIYSKGEKAHFAYYVHSGKVNIYSPGGLAWSDWRRRNIWRKRTITR